VGHCDHERFLCSRYNEAQMWDIVAEVQKYNEFVPWCTQSVVTHRQADYIDCKLQIGFPPIHERYTAQVTLDRPNMVKVGSDGCVKSHFLVLNWF